MEENPKEYNHRQHKQYIYRPSLFGGDCISVGHGRIIIL